MKYLHILLFINFLFSCKVFLQQDDKKITLNHADSLLGKVINGEKVRELIGNVQFTQDNVILNCDRAVQYLETEQVLLFGNIVIRQDTLLVFGKRGLFNSNDRTAEAFEEIKVEDGSRILNADYSKYFINDEKIFFKGNVTVSDTNATLISDELTYYRSEKRTVATGNVKIRDLKSNMISFSNRFENKGNYSYLSDNPQIFQVDTSSDGEIDTLRISSGEIHSYQDSIPHFLSKSNVVIKRGNVTAVAGEAVYYTELDSIELRNKPFIWYEETQVTGDSIFIKTSEQRLKKVFVKGNSFAISRSDSIMRNRFDQMSGNNITMNFEDGEVQSINVDITATSLYYLYETKDTGESLQKNIQQRPNGLNITTGDRIIILFDNNKVDEIKIIGGTEGKYYPENIIFNKENEYNLADFNWRIERPVLPEISSLENKK